MDIREIDAKVAECLGWDIYNSSYDGWYVWRKSDGSTVVDKLAEPFTFFSGDGMLLLIEEARKQGWTFLFSTEENGYECTVFNFMKTIKTYKATEKTAPLAVSLAFLKAKGVDVTPYLEGVAAE